MDLISFILGAFAGFLVGFSWKYIKIAIDSFKKDQQATKQNNISEIKRAVYQIE